MNADASSRSNHPRSAELSRRNLRWGLFLVLIVLLGAIASPMVFQDHWWHSIGTMAHVRKAATN